MRLDDLIEGNALAMIGFSWPEAGPPAAVGPRSTPCSRASSPASTHEIGECLAPK
jgi:hypothetical protein